MVDCISSYAGIPIDLGKHKIDYIMSTSNKCIQGMAGISFAICKKDHLEKLIDLPPRSFYLSLYDQYKYLEANGQTRFTPPVQTLYALRTAIDEFFEEGGENRYKRYTENWKVLRDGLKNLGFEFLLEPHHESHILTTVMEPINENYDFMHMHDLLYKKGFTIYPGKKPGQNTFRLACMGDIYPDDIQTFLNELSQVLRIMDIEYLKY